MAKLNCWEYKKCGREKGGGKVDELGVCPASLEVRLNGIHEGKNGGRACWVIAGTLCTGKVQGSFVEKFHGCFNCDFYNLVAQEEKSAFMVAKEIRAKLK